MANETLRVYCSRAANADFSGIRKEIQIAVRHAKSQPDARTVPCAILFSEIALRYGFEMSGAQASKFIEECQNSLPQNGPWIAVALNICQNGKGGIANMGYLFTRKNSDCKPKREFTHHDGGLLAQLNANVSGWGMYAAWVDRRVEMEKNGEPFPEISLPNGNCLEFRICADMNGRPLLPSESTTTLVSAWGCSDDHLVALLNNRGTVVLNDQNEWRPYVKVNGAKSLAEFGNFNIVSLFQA